MRQTTRFTQTVWAVITVALVAATTVCFVTGHDVSGVAMGVVMFLAMCCI